MRSSLVYWYRVADARPALRPAGSAVPSSGNLLIFPDGSFFVVKFSGHGLVYDAYTATLLSMGEAAWEYVDTVQVSSVVSDEAAVKTGSATITPAQAQVVTDRFFRWAPRSVVWYHDPEGDTKFDYQDAFLDHMWKKATATAEGKMDKLPPKVPTFGPGTLSNAFNRAKNSVATWEGASSGMADPSNPTVPELAGVIAQEMVPVLYTLSPPGGTWSLGHGGSVTRTVYENVCLPYCRGVLSTDEDTLEYVLFLYATENKVSLAEATEGTASSILYEELRREGLSHAEATLYARG